MTSPIQNSNGVLTVKILSDGNDITSKAEVISIEVQYNINQISQATIVFKDGDMTETKFPLSDQSILEPGKILSIEAGYDQKKAPIYQGLIIRHGLTISNNESVLRIECRDHAIAMTVARNNATFTNSKDKDVISKLISNHGLTGDVGSTTTQHKEIVQYYCSDWDFVVSRAEANGLWVITDNKTVTVKKPNPGAGPKLNLTYGIDILEFQGHLDSQDQMSSVQATAWDPAKQKIIEQKSQKNTLTSQGKKKTEDLASVTHVKDTILQSPIPMETEALKTWANAAQLKIALARIRGRVKSQGSSAVKVGDVIEIKGVGQQLSGKTLVTGITHSIQDGNWLTEFRFGTSSQWFSERHHIQSPLASGVTAGIDGLHIGVVQKTGEDPHNDFRVQVSIPLLKTSEFIWARMSHFYGSDTCGAFFYPEVGDEVLLGFLNNDPSNAVILGSLYSAKRKPAETPSNENFIKSITSKSKIVIEMNDEKKILTLKTPGKNTMIIDDDSKSILIKDQHGNSIKMNDGGIAMDSPKDIKLTAKGKMLLDATGAIEIKSKADVNVSGMNVNHKAQVGFVAKGSASAELSASGQTTVKGAMVMIN